LVIFFLLDIALVTGIYVQVRLKKQEAKKWNTCRKTDHFYILQRLRRTHFRYYFSHNRETGGTATTKL